MRIGDRVAIMKDGHVVQVARRKKSCVSRPTTMCATSCAAWMRRPCSRPATLPARARSWCRSRLPAARAPRCRCWKSRTGALCLCRRSQRKFLGWCRPIRCAMRWTATRAAGPGTPICRTCSPSAPMSGGRPVRPGGAIALRRAGGGR
jgi:hypothetical protein